MSDLAIYVIPSEYYGGVAPKKRRVAQNVLGGGAGVVSGAKVHRTFSMGKIFFIVVGVLFVAVVAGAVWYFTRDISTPETQRPVSEVFVPPVAEEPPIAQPPEPETISVTPQETTPQQEQPPALSEDPDHDDLTEAEEVVYGTNSALPDTDQDGYLDGHEVVNLYNPSGIAPEKLEQAALAVRFISSTFGFEILYARSWRANPEEGDRRVIFQSPDGEQITLSFVDILTGQSFEDWAKVQAGDSALAPLTSNKYGRPTFKTGEGTIYIAGAGTQAAVLRYIPASAQSRYHTTLTMMANSFSVRE